MGCGISHTQTSSEKNPQGAKTANSPFPRPMGSRGIAVAGGAGVGVGDVKIRQTVKPQCGAGSEAHEDAEQFAMVMPPAHEGGFQNPSGGADPNMSLKSGYNGGGQSMNNSFAVGAGVGGSVTGAPFKGFGFAPVAGAHNSGRSKSASDGNIDEEGKSVAFYCAPDVPELLVAVPAGPSGGHHGGAGVSAPQYKESADTQDGVKNSYTVCGRWMLKSV